MAGNYEVIGEGLQKIAAPLPVLPLAFPVVDGIYGYNDAVTNPKDRAALIEKYDLPHEADLKWRNAGRQFTGSAIGTGLGMLAGGTIGSLIAENDELGKYVGATGGGLIGSIIGDAYAGNRYSTDSAKRALSEGFGKKKKED